MIGQPHRSGRLGQPVTIVKQKRRCMTGYRIRVETIGEVSLSVMMQRLLKFFATDGITPVILQPVTKMAIYGLSEGRTILYLQRVIV